jgi:hypothetical protein
MTMITREKLYELIWSEPIQKVAPRFGMSDRGRLTFTPRVNELSGEVDGYEFEGPTRFDKLFSGLACERPSSLPLGDRTGCEDIGPEDTFDGDYGRLLDRAYEERKDVKG